MTPLFQAAVAVLLVRFALVVCAGSVAERLVPGVLLAAPAFCLGQLSKGLGFLDLPLLALAGAGVSSPTV